jgi:hypothetical protein
VTISLIGPVPARLFIARCAPQIVAPCIGLAFGDRLRGVRLVAAFAACSALAAALALPLALPLRPPATTGGDDGGGELGGGGGGGGGASPAAAIGTLPAVRFASSVEEPLLLEGSDDCGGAAPAAGVQ